MSFLAIWVLFWFPLSIFSGVSAYLVFMREREEHSQELIREPITYAEQEPALVANLSIPLNIYRISAPPPPQYINWCFNIDSRKFKEGMSQVKAKEKIDIRITIDGKTRDFTLEQFTRRLFQDQMLFNWK